MNSASRIDVAVVGGGPAGVAAATAASICGASKVLLIEATSQLGGSVAAAMHRSLCGLYSHAPQSPQDTLNAGVQRDVVAEMMSIDSASVVARQLGRTWVLEFPAAAYQKTLENLCDRSNVGRKMNARLTAARRDKSRITAIQIDDKWIEADAVVDCTGSGALLEMIGEEVMLPPDEQRMLGGYSVRLTGLSGEPDMLRLQIPYVLSQAVSRGLLPDEARFTMFQPGPAPGEGICKLAVHPDQITSIAVGLLATQILEHLRSQIDGFSSAMITESSPRGLPRDGRRLKGKLVVSEDDVLQGRQIDPDSVHAWWPIERWDICQGPTYAYPPAGQHYDIPDAALQSAVIENLFAAGTCVSATATAAASLRASGICLATGTAAGCMALRQNRT